MLRQYINVDPWYYIFPAEAGIAAAAEMKQPDERTEEEKMALLGRPKLGEVSRAQIRIKESKEFKNTVDKLVQRANASIILGENLYIRYYKCRHAIIGHSSI